MCALLSVSLVTLIIRLKFNNLNILISVLRKSVKKHGKCLL